eukprot:1144887-Pelagomonas_calceolata.AAC.1
MAMHGTFASPQCTCYCAGAITWISPSTRITIEITLAATKRLRAVYPTLCRGCNLDYTFYTHHHWDYTGSNIEAQSSAP